MMFVIYCLAFISVFFILLSFWLFFKNQRLQQDNFQKGREICNLKLLLDDSKKKKMGESEIFRNFMNDVASGGGILEIRYVDQKDMYFHRR